jgi:beta-glucosidase
MPHGIGQISRPSELRTGDADRAGTARERRVRERGAKWLVEKTRLGIPAMTHEEAHGLTAPKARTFRSIGLASSWDPALLEKVMSVAALKRGRAARTRCCLRC